MNRIILIDNGHGVDTAGKRSPDGSLREYAWAREIAVRIEGELLRRGYNAVRIVSESEDISLPERTRRVNDICRRYGRDNVVLVSVHVNASGCGEWEHARGWSAYTNKGITLSDKLASYLYDAAEKYLLQGTKLRKDMSDGDADWEEGFYILRHTLCPAVLTENLFMDNKDDLAILQSEEGKNAIVSLHVEGIIKYLNDR
jgi:N-acetylmuramoyl-L-alanine amidase